MYIQFFKQYSLYWFILPLLYSTIFILIYHYNFSIHNVIPKFFEAKKFRTKKSEIISFYSLCNNNINLKLINSYKPIFY